MKQLIFLLCCMSSYAINVTTGYTDRELVDCIVGDGLTFDNVTTQRNDESIGLFMDATVEQIGDGIVLSTGNVTSLNSNRNSHEHATRINGLSRDPDLHDLASIEQYVGTYDATYIEFDFVSEKTGILYFDYVFGSEEYGYSFDPNYERYTDVFGFFVDGENIALLSNEDPVGVRTVNNIRNTEYFNDNDYSNPLFDSEMNGFSVPLAAQYEVEAGRQYRLKLGITDCNDMWVNSYVLVDGGSFRVKTQSVPEPELWKLMIVIVVITAVLLLCNYIGNKDDML